MWTTHKEHHSRIGGVKSRIADFMKKDGSRKIGPMHLTGAWESAISMWPVYDHEKAEQVFEWVGNMVDWAYEYYCEDNKET